MSTQPPTDRGDTTFQGDALSDKETAPPGVRKVCVTWSTDQSGSMIMSGKPCHWIPAVDTEFKGFVCLESVK